MSQLYLCQIPEFNKDYKNVGHFSSRSTQLTWLNQKVKTSVSTNTKIDNFLSTIDINQSMSATIRSCDYLFCQSEDGKYLFFFIDNMERLTANTTRLYVSLDVWQTYHLDLSFYPSYVERMHVNRWQDNGMPTIETVSEPFPDYEKVIYYKTTAPYQTDDTSMGVYIYATVDPIGLMDSRPSSASGGGGDTPIPGGDCGNLELGIPSPNGFLFIKGYEGLAQYAYDIGDGVNTIGYGCTDAYDYDHYTTLKSNEPVSDELASSVMAESLVSGYGVPLKNQLASDGVSVSINEFDALLSFVYNAGLGSLINSDMYAYLKSGDKSACAESWLTTNILPGTQFEAGLRARRQAEVNIFTSSTYELRTITIYGEGGSVVGSIEAKESSVPALISNECQQPTGDYDCTDELGNQWYFPASGTISSLFPNYPDGSYHGAIDIAGNSGHPIYPPKEGMTVYSSGWNTGGYGNLVILYDSETNTRHYLAHMVDTPLVSTGQTVSLNTVLGYVGSTGNSTGPHLHWEIRVAPDYAYGESINPCANPILSIGDTIERGV